MAVLQQPAVGLLGESYVVLSPLSQPQKGDLRTATEIASESRCGRSSAVLQATSMHERLLTIGRLIQLTERCDTFECAIPLCEECTSAVVRELLRKDNEGRDNQALLQLAFAELEAGDETHDETLNEIELKLELEAHQLRWKQLQGEIIVARRDHEELQKQAARLGKLLSAQQYKKEARHAHLNSLALTKLGAIDKAQRSTQLLDYCRTELARLKTTDPWRGLFEISSHGAFGTINSLCLGRLPGVSIDWVELNAALGQVVLLISALAISCEFKFSEHGLVPMGSYSKVYKHQETTVAYELYSSGSAPLGRLFGSGRLDRGLAILLCCVSELLALVTANPCSRTAAIVAAADVPDLRDAQAPHAIEGDLVGGHSIRLQFSWEEQWTRAFRNLLENLSWVLAWRTVGNSGTSESVG